MHKVNSRLSLVLNHSREVLMEGTKTVFVAIACVELSWVSPAQYLDEEESRRKVKSELHVFILAMCSE